MTRDRQTLLEEETWIETFLEGVTDKNTGLPLFSELAWFVYKVSGVICARRLCVNTTGLSRDGFTLKGAIGFMRRKNREKTMFFLIFCEKKRTPST
jgi:hypothetical protein